MAANIIMLAVRCLAQNANLVNIGLRKPHFSLCVEVKRQQMNLTTKLPCLD